MDKNLLFETNSARLSSFAKNKLNQIIPVYAQALFSDIKIKDKIAHFNVEGHASPSFSSQPVDPYTSGAGPYNYNLNLSARRANSIVNYIFGEKIKDYPNKLYMRKLTRSVGLGFTQPVKESASRSIASIGEKHDCGNYSCSLSQRVELSFTLKDDPKAIQKIISFQEGQL